MEDIVSLIVLGLFVLNGQGCCIIVSSNQMGVLDPTTVKCPPLGSLWPLCFKNLKVSSANFYIHPSMYQGDHYPGQLKVITRDLQTIADDTLDPLSGMGFGKRKRSSDSQSLGSPLDPMGGFGFGKRQDSNLYWFGDYGDKRGETLDPLAGFGFGKRPVRRSATDSWWEHGPLRLMRRRRVASPSGAGAAYRYELFKLVPAKTLAQPYGPSKRQLSSSRHRLTKLGFQGGADGVQFEILPHPPILRVEDLERLLSDADN